MFTRYDRTLTLGAAILMVWGWCLHPAFASVDCDAAARSEAKTLKNFEKALFQNGSDGQSIEIATGACAADQACQIVVFREGDSSLLPAAPSGFTRVDTKWRPTGQVAAAPGCTNLYSFAFERAAATPPPHTTVEESPALDSFKTEPAAEAATEKAATEKKKQLLRSLKATSARTLMPKGAGVGQVGASGVAEETLQILGQIVVDRASSKGYALVERIQTFGSRWPRLP
jgi:hypothetical protein